MKKLFAVILILLLITVNVSAASTSEADIMRIDIQAKPEKYEYLRGEALDLTDLYITVTYDHGALEKVQVSPDMLSGYWSRFCFDFQGTWRHLPFLQMEQGFFFLRILYYSPQEKRKRKLSFGSGEKTFPGQRK